MEIWQIALKGFAIVVSFTTLLWIISLKIRDASIIDRFWGLLFIIYSTTYSMLSESLGWRQLLVLALVTIWGLRLSLHIHMRNRGHGEDFRYRAMRAEHGSRKFAWYSLFSIFSLQALLAWIISAPLLVIANSKGSEGFTAWDALGLSLWALGFLFEAVSDYQLLRFKRNPENRGKLLTKGLWSLTRHPNYFGDATLWWGYFGFSLSVAGGVYTVFAPLLMTVFIIKVSGVQLLEKDLIIKKPGYEKYIRSTPAFFPNFFLLFKGKREF